MSKRKPTVSKELKKAISKQSMKAAKKALSTTRPKGWLKAKKFLDKKQDEHFDKHGCYADVNGKIAEWMAEYKNKKP